MSNIIFFCPRELGITQQYIRHAAKQVGIETDAEIIEHTTSAIKRLSNELRFYRNITDNQYTCLIVDIKNANRKKKNTDC